MKLKFFQIDSFTGKVFSGNPAGVCPLESWLPDQTLQEIAAENNLSETAFFVKDLGVGTYKLRWFTPEVEVALCGHATLASAWVLIHELGEKSDPIRFNTLSGELRVRRSDDFITLDFPAQLAKAIDPPPGLLLGLGVPKAEVSAAEDYLVVLESEEAVAAIQPDFSLLKGLPRRGIIVTAPGKKVDFVSRWFGPNVGVNEDPVTGSAHTTLTPYWTARLKKSELNARQISRRGGELKCRGEGDRVLISGKAVKYLEGTIEI